MPQQQSLMTLCHAEAGAERREFRRQYNHSDDGVRTSSALFLPRTSFGPMLRPTYLPTLTEHSCSVVPTRGAQPAHSLLPNCWHFPSNRPPWLKRAERLMGQSFPSYDLFRKGWDWLGHPKWWLWWSRWATFHWGALNHSYSIVKTRRHLEPNTITYTWKQPQAKPTPPARFTLQTSTHLVFLRWQSGAPPCWGTGPMFPKHHALCNEGVFSSSSSASTGGRGLP